MINRTMVKYKRNEVIVSVSRFNQNVLNSIEVEKVKVESATKPSTYLIFYRSFTVKCVNYLVLSTSTLKLCQMKMIFMNV